MRQGDTDGNGTREVRNGFSPLLQNRVVGRGKVGYAEKVGTGPERQFSNVVRESQSHLRSLSPQDKH